MCEGGRVVNYLKALVSDPRHDIVFVGYQARGTAGQALQRYGPSGGYVELDDQRYTIKAGIHTISGYSAHADQHNLLNFVKRMRKPPADIRLIHGDEEAKQMLKAALEKTLPKAVVSIP
jgi:metallo-beta-lactamase family protein